MDESVEVVGGLTSENLQSICYNRAKFWSKFMEEKINKSPGVEMNVKQIDDYFCSEDEEQEPESDQDGFEVKESKGNANNDSVLDVSVIEQNTTVSSAQNLLEVIAKNADSTGIVTEDREFLELTLPLFEEHKRILRETGFEKVLNTFDERKIEENVGKMMLYKKQLNISPYLRDCLPNNKYLPQNNADWDNETDSDSLQSFDTARYIRSSKKECNLHKRYASKTTIRSYRLVKSKRDELQEKYSYLVSDEALKNAYTTKRQCYCEPIVRHARSKYNSIDERHISHKSHTIKKRCYNQHSNILFSPYSSEEEDLIHSERHFASKTFSVATLHKHCPHIESNNIYSRTMYSSCDPCHTYHSSFPLKNKRICNYYNHGTLPYVRETECPCKGIDKLCDNMRHLANSSTEDWLVENYESPEKIETSKLRKEQNLSIENKRRNEYKTQKKNNNFSTIQNITKRGNLNVRGANTRYLRAENNDSHEEVSFCQVKEKRKQHRTNKNRHGYDSSKTNYSSSDSEIENSRLKQNSIEKNSTDLIQISSKSRTKFHNIEDKRLNEKIKQEKIVKNESSENSKDEDDLKKIQNYKNDFKKSKNNKKAVKQKKSSNKKPTKVKKSKSIEEKETDESDADQENNVHEDSFEMQLKIAIQASKELFEQEKIKHKEAHKKVEKQSNGDDFNENKNAIKHSVTSKQNYKLAGVQKQLNDKKRFTSKLAAISSENEMETNEDDMENRPLDLCTKTLSNDTKLVEGLHEKQKQQHNKNRNSKAFSNLEFEENKTNTNTNTKSSTNNDTKEQHGKKKILKSKYKDTSLSETEEFKKPKTILKMSTNKKKNTTKVANTKTNIHDNNAATQNEQTKKSNSLKSNSKVSFHTEIEQDLNEHTLKQTTNKTFNSSTDSNNSYTSRLQKLVIQQNDSTKSVNENTIEMSVKTSIDVSMPSLISNGFSENTTFFSNPTNICNSTALNNNNNNIATSRQLLTTTTTTTTTTKTNISNHTAITAYNDDDKPSTSKSNTFAKLHVKASVQDEERATDSSDCTLVTSTTEPQYNTQAEQNQLTTKYNNKKKSPQPKQKRFILYSPHDTTIKVPENSFVGDRYRVTQEQLGTLIGEKQAKYFIRYYRGKREFKLSSTVVYYPPRYGFLIDKDSSTDDDEDIDILALPDVGRLLEES